MNNRLFLCCIALAWITCAAGCGDKGKPDNSAKGEVTGSRAEAEVERRLKEAINDQGKHIVKSVELKKHSDGSYSGIIKTENGDSIPVKNVIVEEKKISWEETIDQTGKGASPPPADAGNP